MGEREAFPSLNEQTSACSDHALLSDQDKKTEAAGISLHQALHLHSLQENGSKLVPSVWIISSTTTATIAVRTVPV